MERRNPNITSLHLSFRNAAYLFVQTGSIGVSERFPSLTDLDLYCYAYPVLLDSLSQLPASLTRLKISAHSESYSTGEPDDDLRLNSIAKLPRSLLSLGLHWNLIRDPENTTLTLDDYENLFPPHLTSLGLSLLVNTAIVEFLPSTLETLELRFKEPDEVEVRTFFLPANLTSLEVNADLLFDSPLPARLAKFEVPESTCSMVLTQDKGNASWAGLPLPPSLEIHPTFVWDIRPDFFPRFKYIRGISIATQWALDELCKSQATEGFTKSISVRQANVRLTNSLPSSTKSLTLRDWMHGEDVAMLPRQLEELSIHIWWQEIDPAMLPRPWTIEQVDLLPKTLRRLHFPFYLVAEGKKLAPIAGCSLDALALDDVPISQLKLAPEWLVSCLPLSLRTLEINGQYEVDDEDDPQGRLKFSALHIATCNLAEVVPHLQTLSISMSFEDDQSVGRFFASLPRNLDTLHVYFPGSAMEIGAISFLPRSIECLNITLASDFIEDSTPGISCEHFEGLPPRLGSLTLRVPRKHTLDTTLLQLLPKTLYLAQIMPSKGGLGQSQMEELSAQNTRDLRNACHPEINN